MEKTIRNSMPAPRSVRKKQEVWSHNLHEELELLNEYIPEFLVVTIDIGWYFGRKILRLSPIQRLNILQLGLTLVDQKENVAMTLEFNFRDFDHISDMKGISLLDLFLKNNGFDFYKLKKDGIVPENFTTLFLPICHSGRIERLITFHGFYEIAYLLKRLKIKFIPIFMATFAATAQHLLGAISNLKHMARYCDGLLDGNLALKKFAKLLDVKRIGTAHFAGFDSLLTASIYTKMKQMFKLPLEQCEGFLYSLPHRIKAFWSILKIINPSATTPPDKATISIMPKDSLIQGEPPQ
ncbi:putative CCR4-associated factor 1 homolog 8 [Momordica charantia]|uniref:CCR4-associated factor 1 homolog 8 n=1 Tax=Momordica charantia TaxID=3673 RepID=A0A6J1DIB1_MOMCH|nr:putative CCR4-associated factor 1 homolog 8 [Momordica charantia]